MINKIYSKAKTFIKENIKTILLYIILICIVTISLPYYISTPGGLIDTNKKIKTENKIKLKGSLNMAYVSEMQATIPTYIWALFNKDWDIEKEEETVIGKETVKEKNYRNDMLLKEANQNALIVAYKNSNVSYSTENNKVFVTYIDEKAKTDLKIKDQIIKINGHEVKNKEFIFDYIKERKIGEKIILTVIRNKKEKQIKTTLINVEGDPKIGVLVTETYDINSIKDIKLDFSKSESGPSGGLMIALTAYSNLNKIDLTKGKKIAGTGTIDEEGNVGEISGVKYKLIGAINKKADIFLVPKGENYKEAQKLKEERNYKIKIIPVETFKEAISKLKD